MCPTVWAKTQCGSRPNKAQVIASAESIWGQLCNQNAFPDGFIKQQKIKNSIKALACNFDDQQLNIDNKHIKILKNCIKDMQY